MRPWELLREVGAATRAQRVPAAMVAALTAIMCAATIATVGRATRAEQEVRDRLESAGSRVAVLRDAKNAAVLPGLLVRQSSALDLVNAPSASRHRLTRAPARSAVAASRSRPGAWSDRRPRR